MLLFKQRFLAAIRDGSKTQTIRMWPYRRMRSGQRSYIPGAGYIEVLHVEPVAVEALTDSDALPDGFESASALRAELARLYDDLAAGEQQAYRVTFRLLDTTEQEAVRREKHGRGRRSGDGSDPPNEGDVNAN